MDSVKFLKPIYLACPYTHKDAEIREYRFNKANEAARTLILNGYHVFSPISHTHPIALLGNLPISWAYWAEYDKQMLSMCQELCVLKIFGWDTSVGVTAEREIARKLRLKLTQIYPGDKFRSSFKE